MRCKRGQRQYLYCPDRAMLLRFYSEYEHFCLPVSAHDGNQLPAVAIHCPWVRSGVDLPAVLIA